MYSLHKLHVLGRHDKQWPGRSFSGRDDPALGPMCRGRGRNDSSHVGYCDKSGPGCRSAWYPSNSAHLMLCLSREASHRMCGSCSPPPEERKTRRRLLSNFLPVQSCRPSLALGENKITLHGRRQTDSYGTVWRCGTLLCLASDSSSSTHSLYPGSALRQIGSGSMH